MARRTQGSNPEGGMVPGPGRLPWRDDRRERIKARFDMLAPLLDERGRRLFAATEAQAAGREDCRTVGPPWQRHHAALARCRRAARWCFFVQNRIPPVRR